ncbi:MATE family efflux transporter, partial [Synergistaceae bacterium OttesenSCG-928-I11]|nr:MATE family efflux transporter [Synergistaceae bacterium OttesenSCG-928-I11]
MQATANDKKFMESEPIPRLLARFAAPALVGMLANALYNIVDRIFVGQTVGRDGLAAIALAFPCMLFFISVGFLVGIGSASRVSILLGEKRTSQAERTLGNSLTLATVLSFVLLAGGAYFFREILLLSGTSEHLYPIAANYLHIVMYGVIFSIVSFTLSCQIRACGSPTFAMGTQVVGAVANIVLDAWFVIGRDMGVEGAAIATVISQILSCGWAMAYFFLPKSTLTLRWRDIVRLDRATVARIFAVGVPSCLVHLNFVLVHGVITNASSTYGGDLAVSATGVFMSLDSLLFMPAIAIAEACQPIIGYNFGAGKPDRVIKTVKAGMLATTAFYVTSFAVLMLFAEYMVMMFNRDDAELIALTSRAIRVANVGIPFMGLTVINTSFLQGLGKGREGLMIAVIRFGIFLWIPLLILPKYFGVLGAWG